MKTLGLGGNGVGNIFDSIKNLVTTGTNIYNQNAGLLDQYRDAAVSSVVSNLTPAQQQAQTQQQQQAALLTQGNGPSASSMSTGAKIAIGVGVVAIVGGIYYVVAGKKKKGLSGGSSGVADDNKATSTVFNGPGKESRKRKK